jgi:hypothetical protein
MGGEIKQALVEVATSAKTSWITGFSTLFASAITFYVDVIHPFITYLTPPASLFLLFVMARYHMKKSNNLDVDTDIKKENLRQMRKQEQINAISERKNKDG